MMNTNNLYVSPNLNEYVSPNLNWTLGKFKWTKSLNFWLSDALEEKFGIVVAELYPRVIQWTKGVTVF